MMRRLAKVREVREDGTVVLEIMRHSACAHCGACDALGGRRSAFTAADRVGVSPGDVVQVEMAEGGFLAACVLLFLLPLIGALVVLLASGAVAPGLSDGARALLVLGSVPLWWLLARFFSRRTGLSARMRPVVVRIVETSSAAMEDEVG